VGREKPADEKKFGTLNRKPPAFSSVHKHCTVSDGKQLALLIPGRDLLGCVEATAAVCPLTATPVAFALCFAQWCCGGRWGLLRCFFSSLFLLPEKR